MTNYSVTIFVTVTDPAELLALCLDTAPDQGLTAEQLREMLTDDGGQPDVPACLRWVADPGLSWAGTEIVDSYAEEDTP